MRPYEDLRAEWKSLRGNGEVLLRDVACVGAPRTLLCAEIGDANAPAIVLAAGVHGDEPAGPWAALNLAACGALDPRFHYRIWPCTNPSGYSRGTRENQDGVDVNRNFGRGGQTPEARAIVTANRDRKFALSIDLHEDCDAEGFYCYEYGRSEVARAVIDAVRESGFPIQDLARCDLGAPFAAAKLHDGVVAPHADAEQEAIGGISYSMYMVRRSASIALTLETPTRFPFETRSAMHSIAVKAAIAALSNLPLHG